MMSEGPKKWTQEELDTLHEMLQEYKYSRWFRGKLKLWMLWVIGIPATALAVVEPIWKLIKLAKGGP